MAKGYLLVEGHGEVKAAGNLVTRLCHELGSPLVWTSPIRWKNLHRRDGLERGAEHIRRKRDAAALLILRDEDDACPKDKGPEMACWLAELCLPFPSAVVLLKPEYEVLFLPCLPLMAGQPLGSRPGLPDGAAWDGETWESRRGIKEWLSSRFPPNRSYKPSLDQLPLTRLIDFAMLRKAGVPCFGTLERALASCPSTSAKVASTLDQAGPQRRPAAAEHRPQPSQIAHAQPGRRWHLPAPYLKVQLDEASAAG